MESSFENFQSEFEIYTKNYDEILTRRLKESITDEEIHYLHRESVEFQNLDIKIRLSFGISEIILNPSFVLEKAADLKFCHLLYYKLADIWFAYETYIKFFTIVKERRSEKDKIVWIGKEVFQEYAKSPIILKALENANILFKENFSLERKKEELLKYLEYCAEQGINRHQRLRLNEIKLKIDNEFSPLSNVDFLTIIYAIRNNFVHDGETTISPNNFDFENKRILLNILYTYFCVFLLNSINITCNNIKK